VRQVLWVFFSGGVGSAARYLFAGWVLRTFGGAFSYGTIAINTLGSFLIVIFMNLGLANVISADTRLVLTTGLLGGFTTYSTFNYETISFFQRGAWLLGALNVLVTVVVCLLAGGLGLLASRAFAS
jgi:CrcB protein